tara:strand:- start:698 stop:1177 length:480 start_codon:yes stop_codon:yes gene_type:complete
MKQITIKSLLFLLLFITVNCGFKTLDESQKSNFYIQDIKTSGNKRINFKIKNNLSIYSTKNNKNILVINLNTKKIKNIKEKNIKNEITKYQISLSANVKFNLINNNNVDYEINLSNAGDYLVNNKYSTTLNNEKTLINNLVEDMSEKIIREIGLKLNDI